MASKAAASKIKVSKPKNGVQYSQSEFYEFMQESCGLDSKKQTKEVYESFADMLQAALKKGYVVPLPGLGKFEVKKRKARMARNPRTGEPVKVPAKKVVKLQPNKALKDAVL